MFDVMFKVYEEFWWYDWGDETRWKLVTKSLYLVFDDEKNDCRQCIVIRINKTKMYFKNKKYSKTLDKNWVLELHVLT